MLKQVTGWAHAGFERNTGNGQKSAGRIDLTTKFQSELTMQKVSQLTYDTF